MSSVAPRSGIDTVREKRKCCGNTRMDVLLEAQQYWSAMDRFRKERERNIRYAFGDQWSDVVCVDGKFMTEAEYIAKQGNIPLKNNLINRLVRNVIGVWRSQDKDPTCIARDREEQQLGETMTTVLQYVQQLNQAGEVNARSLMEFLLSGFVVHRKWYGEYNGKLDCWTEYVNPNNFIIDTNARDFLGRDCTFVGEVHDIDFKTLAANFAQSPKDYRRLQELYEPSAQREDYISRSYNDFGYDKPTNYSFFTGAPNGTCRVVEVWRKETKGRWHAHDLNSGEVWKCEEEDKALLIDEENARRIEMGLQSGIPPEEIPLIEAHWMADSYWYFYYLTPTGEVICEGETPYEHGEHPYVWKAFPFINGEIHSFVGDIIDQQRYVNRLITLYDWVMRASAKGVLLFPEDALPDDMTLDDIAEEWSRFDGVIAIKAKPGQPMPQQISQNATQIGIEGLLNLQLKFFEDISGVNGALQGKPGYSSTSGTLYAQQASNATTSLLDLLECFSSFVVESARKDVKNIQQFYDTRRYIHIAGRKSVAIYEPGQMRDVDFDLSITQSKSTPAYRSVTNELLMQLLQQGQINLRQMLEVGQFDFADDLLQKIENASMGMQPGMPAVGGQASPAPTSDTTAAQQILSGSY